MDRSTLKIFLRAKGRLDGSSISLSKDLHEITVADPQNKDPVLTFDCYRIFIESPQEEVFEITSRPLIEHVLDGSDSLIIAYGPSKTGKSYTLFGLEIDSGIFLRSVQTILEEAEKVSSQKVVRIMLTALELFDNNFRDLALAYTDPHALSTFQSQRLDMKEVNGRMCVDQTCEIPIRNISEATAVIQQINDMRATLEAKQGKYIDKAHTIVALKIRQKYITSEWDQFSESIFYLVELPGSEKPKLRKGNEFLESLNASSSFHALSKCLANLNSVSSSFSDHKITKILEYPLKNNSQISLIGTAEIWKENNEETLRTLSFLDKCKMISGNMPFGESSNADFTIKILQDERAMLKEKLQKLDSTQEDQLKKIAKVLGIDCDIETLLQASPGSRELQRLASQKEAVARVDFLTRKNREIEKKVEENKKVLERIKKADFQLQDKHLRQVLEIKDELTKFKEMLEECKMLHEHNTRSQLQTKTMELTDMLTNSQTLLEEKLKVLQRLPKGITSNFALPDLQKVKELGKNEVVKEFNKRFVELEKDANVHYNAVENKLKMHLEQREKMLEDIQNDFEGFKSRKEKDISALNKEIKQLFEVAKSQKNVLNKIQSGDYNQHISSIDYPESIIPEFPTEKYFPK